MELLPAVDIECVNNPIQVSFCADNSIKSTEFGGECHFVAVNSDETTQQHREYVVCSSPVQDQLFERIRHSTDNSDEADQDENFWLQRNEEYEFDMLDGISDISVDSDDYPIPEPKITLESIAQRWLDKMTSDDRNGEPGNNKLTNGVEEPHVAKMDEPANSDNENKSTESVKDIKARHSPSPDCSNNSIQPQPTNSTFTKVEGSCTEVDVDALNHTSTPSNGDKDNYENSNAATVPQKTSVPQLQAPSTKNAINEQMVCGEVAVIRECCNTTVEIETSSVMLTESLAHKGAIEKTSKPPVHSSVAVLKKKGPVVPPNIKPLFATRKLKNNSTIKTPTKANHSLQNSNQSHLPNQETKFSKLVKQKEPLNIRKSLLSRPIVVSKTATKTEGAVSAGPTKPAKLKRPVDKVNTSSHPVQSSTQPDHSTPIKNQGNFRRRSVAVSPQRDSSKANDDDKIKHKRRSGIPHFGAMTRDMKVPMSPCNKGDLQKNDLGMSPIAAVKRPFQPTKGKRQIGIPKPKTQLNFNTSIDPLEGLDLDGPPPGGSKLIHSPAEKENKCDTVHSQWSPIKRNKGGLTAEDECIRCTKHVSKMRNNE